MHKFITEKNKTHNLKGEADRTILIDKQGFMAAFKAIRKQDVTVRKEIKRKQHLFELAIAIQRFLSEYPKYRLAHRNEADYLYYAAEPYIAKPDLTFSESATSRLAWQLLLERISAELNWDSPAGLDS